MIYWVVYNEHPFNEFRIFKRKPSLIEASGRHFWESSSEYGIVEYGIVITDCVKSILKEEEIKKLLKHEAVKVIITPVTQEYIQPPEDPRDLENFRNGILYTLQD